LQFAEGFALSLIVSQTLRFRHSSVWA
jgi:hypothetical protein